MIAMGRYLMLLVLGVLMAAPVPSALGAAPFEVAQETFVSALPWAYPRQAEMPTIGWQGLAGLAPTRQLGSQIHLPRSVPLFTLFCVWRE
ncbi:MAG: hypothetical protein SNJ82_01400 [Gemmataceae bacterium]